MSDGLGLYMKDLYPNYVGTDTGINATPDVNDQDSLNENVADAEKASVNEASRKNIFIALAILLCAIVLFGVGGR